VRERTTLHSRSGQAVSAAGLACARWLYSVHIEKKNVSRKRAKSITKYGLVAKNARTATVTRSANSQLGTKCRQPARFDDQTSATYAGTRSRMPLYLMPVVTAMASPATIVRMRLGSCCQAASHHTVSSVARVTSASGLGAGLRRTWG